MYLECSRGLACLTSLDDTGSLGSPPRRVVYSPGSTLGDCLLFLAGNREAELKLTTFSSLLLFRIFLSFLFSPMYTYMVRLLLPSLALALPSKFSRAPSPQRLLLNFNLG